MEDIKQLEQLEDVFNHLMAICEELWNVLNIDTDTKVINNFFNFEDIKRFKYWTLLEAKCMRLE